MTETVAETAAGPVGEHAGALAPKPAGRSWVLVAIMATMFMASVEGTVVATAMPTIVAKLGGFALFSWVFTSYLLTQAIAVPIYGSLSDVYGRKKVLFAGIGIFVLGSILCGLSWNMPSLIIFRAIQGIGAGGLWPVGITIIGDIYGPTDRPRIQGYLSSTWATAAILGPALGAYLVTHLSWPMVFWINLPVAVMTVLMLTFGFRERVQSRPHPFDLWGSILMAAATAALISALVHAASLPPAVWGSLFALSLLLFTAFVQHERRTAEPLVPVGLWRERIIVSGNLANFGFGGIIMAVSAFLPTYVQGATGGAPFDSALVLGLMSLSWPLGAMAAGRLMLGYSYRFATAVGGISLVAGGIFLATLEPSQPLIWAAAGAGLTGLGLGIANNTVIVVVQASVEWRQRGAATSGMVFTRMIGQSLATAVFGGILNADVAEIADGGRGLIDRLLDPAQRQALPTAQLEALAAAVAGAIHRIYLIDAFLALLVVVSALLLPKGLNPLRTPRN